MWWWITGYLVVGVLIAGLAVGFAKERPQDVSVPKFLSFLLLWPVLFVFFLVAILCRRAKL